MKLCRNHYITRVIFILRNDIYAIANCDNVFVIEVTIITFINILSILNMLDVKNAQIITTKKIVKTNSTNASFVKTNIKRRVKYVLVKNISEKS